SAAALVVLLGGCQTVDDPNVAELDVVRVQDEAAVDAVYRGIRLRTGDIVEIRLGGVPPDETVQINGTYTVDSTGNVNMPQIGPVRALGQTQQALQSEIESRYRATGIYTTPTISVSVPLEARFVNVGGEVRLPQRISYTTDLTILAAINAAGGFTEYAAQNRLRLVRGGKVLKVNVKLIRRNPGLDIVLEPGDTIEVMRSFF
ncbi:MAG: polysaccharide biosynthesis/export family protein, partial [Chthoniobacterales bacterium]